MNNVDCINSVQKQTKNNNNCKIEAFGITYNDNNVFHLYSAMKFTAK